MAATHAAAMEHSRPWTEGEFTDLLRTRGCFATGTPACFALVRVVADEAELLTIATRPDSRRQGLARACMAQWQHEAAARGARRAFLEVAADNAPAVALYRSCGFAVSGRRRGYYRRAGGHGADALLMSRELTQGKPAPDAPRDQKSG